MRTAPILAIVMALVPRIGASQTPAPPTPAPPPGAQAAAADPQEPDKFALPTTYGRLDLGLRGSDISGDAARYERYRDLGNGAFVEIGRLYSEQNGWVFDAEADHAGRRDQRYAASAVRPGRVKVWGQWDQIPMLMSETTRTLFTAASPGVLEIDDAVQASVQAQPSSLAAAVVNARRFDLESRRHIFNAGAQFIARNGITVDTSVRRTNREGSIPFGGSFGHGQVVETLAPVNHSLTDVDTSLEYASGDLLVRGGYTGSWFHNDVTSLTFDNPFRLNDSATASSRGRVSLAPSNSSIGVNGLVSYRLPYRSRVSVYGSVARLEDSNEPLLPFTVNTAVTSPALDRATTDGEARMSSVNLGFTSRPTRAFDVDVRFRTYDYDNRTPVFTTTQRVAYDNAVSTVTNEALQHSEPFGVKRATFDADVRVRPIDVVSASVGYGHQSEERTHRIFEDVGEHVFRLGVDSTSLRWFTLRTKYEHGERRGEGDAAEIGAELSAIGEQPGMRHFDIASRDRDRVTVTGLVLPLPSVSLTGSFAAGKDDYGQSEFGLRDNTHRVYSAGFDFLPSEYFGTGLSYSFERYDSLSRSRQANPGAQQTDPSRNWSADTSDRAHSVMGHFEMREFRQRIDFNAFVDYNRATGLYRYITGSVPDRTLPEEVIVPTTLPDPTQLPDVRSHLTRANIDLIYLLGSRWGLGGSIWYERYRIDDFSLDAEAISRLDPAGGLLLGYTYQPYTATTFWLRAIYKF